MSQKRSAVSRPSHKLAGRHRTRADGLGIQWTLICGYGFRRTDRRRGIDLRIRRLGVRVPPCAPRSTASSDHGVHCCWVPMQQLVQQPRSSLVSREVPSPVQKVVNA